MNAHYYPDIMIMIVTIFVIWNVPCQPDYVAYLMLILRSRPICWGKKCFFNKKFLQTRSVTLITSKCILLPAAFLKERMNQVKNRYAEIVEHRSYKSILKATQAKNSNIYNQIKCVLEYSKNICKE